MNTLIQHNVKFFHHQPFHKSLSLDYRQEYSLKSFNHCHIQKIRKHGLLKAISIQDKTQSTFKYNSSSSIKDKNISYMFSPAGFLVPYYVGVISCLRDHKMIKSDTIVSGTSAGAIATAIIKSDLEIEYVMESVKELICKLNKIGFRGKVINLLISLLNDILPDDIHTKVDNSVGIGVTKYNLKKRSISGSTINKFKSKNDFVNAVAASCYIPFYLGPGFGLESHDGNILSDGLPTRFWPDTSQLLKNEKKEKLIKISALPYMNRRLISNEKVDISPDIQPNVNKSGFFHVLWKALVPYTSDEVDLYFENGYNDTKLWIHKFRQNDKHP